MKATVRGRRRRCDEATLLYGPGHVVAELAWAPSALVVGVWRRGFACADVLELRRALLDARRGPAVALLTILDTDAMDLRALEDPQVRVELVRLARDLAPRVAASAIVVEGRGFKSAAIRTASAGVTLVARPPFPSRTFDAVPPAIAWLARRVDSHGVGDAQDLTTAIEALRARLAAA